MYSPEINFKILDLVKKTYEGGKLHSWYQNESGLKENYMQNVRKSWLGLLLIVCMIAPFGLSSLYTEQTAGSIFAGFFGKYSDLLSLLYYLILLLGTPMVFVLSVFTLQLSHENLNNIRYFQENPKGIQQLEESKQSMEDFANDKKTLLDAVKHINNEHLLKLLTDDATEQWAKDILKAEAQERSKWLHTTLMNH